mmetsp:Transcript_107581/g.302899  ORF Transcript_107581/g.302899 Transcript_107581/m.302899 type:complete len:228 (+) Transcript_107581:709-1392(+)
MHVARPIKIFASENDHLVFAMACSGCRRPVPMELNLLQAVEVPDVLRLQPLQARLGSAQKAPPPSKFFWQSIDWGVHSSCGKEDSAGSVALRVAEHTVLKRLHRKVRHVRVRHRLVKLFDPRAVLHGWRGLHAQDNVVVHLEAVLSGWRHNMAQRPRRIKPRPLTSDDYSDAAAARCRHRAAGLHWTNAIHFRAQHVAFDMSGGAAPRGAACSRAAEAKSCTAKAPH